MSRRPFWPKGTLSHRMAALWRPKRSWSRSNPTSFGAERAQCIYVRCSLSSGLDQRWEELFEALRGQDRPGSDTWLGGAGHPQRACCGSLSSHLSREQDRIKD